MHLMRRACPVYAIDSRSRYSPRQVLAARPFFAALQPYEEPGFPHNGSDLRFRHNDFVHMHVPKCAGLTSSTIFKMRLESRLAVNGEAFTFRSEEMCLGGLRRDLSSSETVAMFRSPRSHVVSMFFYLRGHGGWCVPDSAEMAAQNLSLTLNESYAASPNRNPKACCDFPRTSDLNGLNQFVSFYSSSTWYPRGRATARSAAEGNYRGSCYTPVNMQARALSCQESSADDLHRAKSWKGAAPPTQQTLAGVTGLSFAGIAELHVESMCLFQYRVNSILPYACECPHNNRWLRVGRHYKGHSSGIAEWFSDNTCSLGPALLKKIDNITKVDQELYRSAVSRFIKEIHVVEAETGINILCPSRIDEFYVQTKYIPGLWTEDLVTLQPSKDIDVAVDKPVCSPDAAALAALDATVKLKKVSINSRHVQRIEPNVHEQRHIGSEKNAAMISRVSQPVASVSTVDTHSSNVASSRRSLLSKGRAARNEIQWPEGNHRHASVTREVAEKRAAREELARLEYLERKRLPLALQRASREGNSKKDRARAAKVEKQLSEIEHAHAIEERAERENGLTPKVQSAHGLQRYFPEVELSEDQQKYGLAGQMRGIRGPGRSNHKRAENRMAKLNRKRAYEALRAKELGYLDMNEDDQNSRSTKGRKRHNAPSSSGVSGGINASLSKYAKSWRKERREAFLARQATAMEASFHSPAAKAKRRVEVAAARLSERLAL